VCPLLICPCRRISPVSIVHDRSLCLERETGSGFPRDSPLGPCMVRTPAPSAHAPHQSPSAILDCLARVCRGCSSSTSREASPDLPARLSRYSAALTLLLAFASSSCSGFIWRRLLRTRAVPPTQRQDRPEQDRTSSLQHLPAPAFVRTGTDFASASKPRRPRKEPSWSDCTEGCASLACLGQPS
jgi:hypothetical protein